jgi:osmotically-inducible protein OsmY
MRNFYMKKNRYPLNILSLSTLCVLSACDPITVIGAGAIIGTTAAEERGIEGLASDTTIRAKINYAWMTHDSKLIDQISLSVQKGVVVLTGIAENQKIKMDAVRLAKETKGVGKVIDEIKLGTPTGFQDYTRDAWISAKLKTAILMDERIRSRNYSIRTVDKILYLTGIAQNQQELELVKAHAREVPNVRQVISHVQFLKK